MQAGKRTLWISTLSLICFLPDARRALDALLRAAGGGSAAPAPVPPTAEQLLRLASLRDTIGEMGFAIEMA